MPTPSELAAHYERYYLTRLLDADSIQCLVRMHEPIASWLTARLSRTANSAVLDYGFGSGAFLICMAKSGHRAFGIDVSRQNVAQLVDYCRSHDLHIAAACPDGRSLCDIFGTQMFGLITLFQVVEHLVDPLSHLVQLSKRQAPGDIIYIECPNQAAVLNWLKRFTRVGNARKTIWGSLRNPEHVHGFNKRTLTRLLEFAGYEVEICSDYGYRDGIHQVEAEYWWPRFSRNANLKSVFGLSRSLIPLADQLFCRLFASGSGLFALARKRE